MQIHRCLWPAAAEGRWAAGIAAALGCGGAVCPTFIWGSIRGHLLPGEAQQDGQQLLSLLAVRVCDVLQLLGWDQGEVVLRAGRRLSVCPSARVPAVPQCSRVAMGGCAHPAALGKACMVLLRPESWCRCPALLAKALAGVTLLVAVTELFPAREPSCLVLLLS